MSAPKTAKPRRTGQVQPRQRKQGLTANSSQGQAKVAQQSGVQGRGGCNQRQARGSCSLLNAQERLPRLHCDAANRWLRLNSTATKAIPTGNATHHTTRDTIVAAMIPSPPKAVPAIHATPFTIKSHPIQRPSHTQSKARLAKSVASPMKPSWPR